MENKDIHTHRYIARFKIEADTPLFIGSGEASLMTDALVLKDVNGFPMIAGTSLAGVLRHAFGKENADKIFGDTKSDKNCKASKLRVSSALMVLGGNLISEEINLNIGELLAMEIKNKDGEITEEQVSLIEKFNNLPSRQHVRISDKGVAIKNGLFDNEVVYKGTQFVFELEVRGTGEDKENWIEVLKLVQSPMFRIGSGTRNGYGSLKVIEMYQETFDLEKADQFEKYLNFDPSLNAVLNYDSVANDDKYDSKKFTKYSLNLQPDSFFIFSEGFGDDDADNKPLEEEVIRYENGNILFEKQTVIPATSIKGAIAHRVAFYYNKLKGNFADGKNQDELKEFIGDKNLAVATLFGKAGKEVLDPSAGNVFINDFYFSEEQVKNNKIFNHVAIDRFTGGAMKGALFSEKVSNLVKGDFSFDIYVKSDILKDEIGKAFENTLKDICKGLLPLGGMTTKGNGIFTGSVLKENKELNYESN
jgi:CRISPR/Cas system CSM-associated protein Csm3 (group 7 of RAMP superfamily)